MNRYKYIFICLIVGFSLHSPAQDFILGVKYGYGKAVYKRQSDGLMTPDYPTHRIGISLEFSPYFSKLFVVSGVEYEANDLGSTLTLPLGFRIAPGNRIRPFLELGGYLTHNLKSRQEDYLLTNDLGARVGVGVLYALNKRIRFELGYFRRYGFRGAVVEEILLPGNQVSSENYDLRAGNLEFVAKYRF